MFGAKKYTNLFFASDMKNRQKWLNAYKVFKRPKIAHLWSKMEMSEAKNTHFLRV